MVSSIKTQKKATKGPLNKKVKIEKTKKVANAKVPLIKLLKENKPKNVPLEKVKNVPLEKVKDETDNKKKKSKFVMPSKYITESIVESCLNALDQLAVCTKNKNVIFEDEQQIFAEIHCIKIQTSRGNIKFVLPYSTAASTGEICLITPDLKKGKKIDHEPTVEHWEEILRKANVTNVKTVLPIRQLKVEYDQFELKRRLLTQHDFIMVDTRVLNHVSHILGKMFFKKHNMLIPVRLNEKDKDVKKCIDVGLRTSMLRLSEGPTSTILIGHTGMPKEKLKDNILAFVKQLNEKYPGGENNIRSIAIKLPLSLSLPLYITLRPVNTIVNPPRLLKKKPKQFTIVEDELTTIPNSTVRVAPDGTVHLKRGKSSDDEIEVEESSENSEEETDKEE